jgi:hypothetical protein
MASQAATVLENGVKYNGKVFQFKVNTGRSQKKINLATDRQKLIYQLFAKVINIANRSGKIIDLSKIEFKVEYIQKPSSELPIIIERVAIKYLSSSSPSPSLSRKDKTEEETLFQKDSEEAEDAPSSPKEKSPTNSIEECFSQIINETLVVPSLTCAPESGSADDGGDSSTEMSAPASFPASPTVFKSRAISESSPPLPLRHPFVLLPFQPFPQLPPQQLFLEVDQESHLPGLQEEPTPLKD